MVSKTQIRLAWWMGRLKMALTEVPGNEEAGEVLMMWVWS